MKLRRSCQFFSIASKGFHNNCTHETSAVRIKQVIYYDRCIETFTKSYAYESNNSDEQQLCWNFISLKVIPAKRTGISISVPKPSSNTLKRNETIENICCTIKILKLSFKLNVKLRKIESSKVLFIKYNHFNYFLLMSKNIYFF